jgi:PIN domain-containing protein
MIPAHGVSTILYLLAKARGGGFARDGVERMLTVFDVAPIDATVLRRALTFGWADVEDAVCVAAVESAGCRAIVTRDPDGYRNAVLPVIDPAAAISWLMSTRGRDRK